MADKILLPEITLVAVSSVDLDNTQLALKKSCRDIQFGAVKFLSSAQPFQIDPDIDYVRVPPMDLRGYSKFILGDLIRFIDTPFCLVVQADGFVLNPHSFSREFLDYDYVGAPWPAKLSLQPGNTIVEMNKNRVGNGGFSLRSAKLLETTAQIDFDALAFPTASEDMIVCHYLYDEMIGQGIRFPSPEIAARFSIESQGSFFGQDLESAFGFHGKYLRDAVVFNENRNKILETTSAQPNRLAPCPCGSGLRYKHCHGAAK